MNVQSHMTLIVLLLWCATIRAAPSQLVPRNWACPRGWVMSGGQCVTNPCAGQVVPQRGACPSGMKPSGRIIYPRPAEDW